MSSQVSTDGTSQPDARIYDVRYARFTGQLRPRYSSVLALARSSAGRALGLRRSAGAKVWPFLLLGFAYLPAVIVVGVPLVTGSKDKPLDLMSYTDMLRTITLVIVAYAATTIPSLLTRERRDRVLSLYFSTALSPAEYIAGKVLAAVGLLLLVTLGPLLVLLLGSILTADAPLTELRHHSGDFPRVLAAGLVVAAFHAALCLALGALTPKRVFAVGGYLATVLVTAVLSGLLYSLNERPAALVLDLAQVPVNVVARILPDAARSSGESVQSLAPAGLSWTVEVAMLCIGALVLAFRYHSGKEK